MKLVRDRIPELSGLPAYSCPTADRLPYLQAKVVEEAQEFACEREPAKLLAEAADVAEALDALLSLLGYTREDLRLARIAKMALRGGFERGYVMEFEA